MNKFTYENQGTNTYLVYEITPMDIVDSMSLGMLTNNKILGLAPTLFTQMDMTKYIKYNVSAKISVRQFFMGHVNKKRLLGVFSGIVDAMLSAEDYMIDVNSILLDLDYIFADVSSCETVLVCLPVVDLEKQNLDLGLFFKNIMFSTQFDPTENCDHVAKIINYLNSTPVFSLVDFKDLLEDIKGRAINQTSKSEAQLVQDVQQAKVVKQPVITPVQQSLVTPVTQSVVNTVQQAVVTPLVQSQINIPNSATEIKQVLQGPQNTLKNEQPIIPKEKEMSMFYLLQHYSKENAALYKAQKAAKKNTKPEEKMKDKKKGKETVSANQGFAVPGQTPVMPTPQPTVQSIQQQAVVSQISPSKSQVANTVSVQQPSYIPRTIPQGKSMNFGETIVLGGSGIGETTVLNMSQTSSQIIAPHLIRSKNSEKISLNKPVFRVGKERSYVDYFIGDNTAISRSHANFIIRDSEYFIVDTNSTNHTFVNGTMIQSNIETPISHGDKIRLANEDFEFKLY